jgi:uncharacterized protein YyaL (SSP411 family)
MMRFSPNTNRSHLIHWFEWSEEAFRAAEQQDKPVMLFLSAFWCRYCQRMDEEAFSETENIALLRAYFISIRAENAQRPDIDVRYNQNGWPTIVFMTPQGEPIVAANYLQSDHFQELLFQVYLGHQQRQEAAGSVNSSASKTVETASGAISRAQVSESDVAAIAKSIMELADRVHGGYGNGQKFIQTAANDFLLSQFQATGNAAYLDHVCLTLDRMREGAIRDGGAGGYFRTSTGPDWDQPHREKLLAEQAGLVLNCLWTYRITQRREYAAMAEDIIGYLNTKLSDESSGAFYGCEDFLRVESAEPGSRDEFFTIIDRCVYTDANALAITAYLEASAMLGQSEYKARALKALEFLWDNCRDPQGGMFHFFNGAPKLSGWLSDQVFVGTALLKAFGATGERKYLERAKELAEFIINRLKNPAGGYHDIVKPGFAHLGVKLTLIEQNGPLASFFLALASATKEARYRDDALWALAAFTEAHQSYGIHAAAYGTALGEYLALATVRRTQGSLSSPANAGEDKGGG